MARPRRWQLCTWAWLACLLPAGLAAQALQPIEHFTRPAAIDVAQLSPSGQRLALITQAPTGFKQLAVMALDPIGTGRVVASFDDADIQTVRWVNDDRLVFEAFQRKAEVKERGAGTFAVNHDGSDLRPLIAWHYATSTEIGHATRLLPYGWFIGGTVDDGSNEVLVYRTQTDSVGDLEQIEFARLDTVERTLRRLSFGIPPGARTWHFDTKGQPRIIVTYRNGRSQVHWRDGEQWKPVADFDGLKDTGFAPWFIDEKGQVTVTTRSLHDSRSIHLFDPVSKKLDPEPLIRVPGFDLDASPEYDSRTGRLVGMHFMTDRPTSYWFDDAVQKVQKGVDAALPAGRSNQLLCGRCESTRFFVVHSVSDRMPGEYYLFDRKSSKLQHIGSNRPWIDEKRQGRRSFHRVATRDGLSMPVYVTHPVDAKPDQPLPAVVLVHGGPWVRGSDVTWKAEAQFLASRGYRVIEPEFRGSEGYGSRHFKAGWKQWGFAIQDDLHDAVAWAAANKLIDRTRVCIYGASFGGYSALMSPVAHPGSYRCAVSFAGVTDIDLMYSVAWSDLSADTRRYSMPVLIGDPKTDAEQLAKQSPLRRVGEIKVPVLMAHGGLDRRVPITHADRFAKAARAANVDLEYVEYPDQGHGWFDPAPHTDFYGKLERFLAKTLKPGN